MVPDNHFQTRTVRKQAHIRILNLYLFKMCMEIPRFVGITTLKVEKVMTDLAVPFSSSAMDGQDDYLKM